MSASAHLNARPRNPYRAYIYTWDQVFPAGKILVVEHQYRASPTTGFYSAALDQAFCVEPSLQARLKKMGDSVPVHDLRYILRTGANWKGPIDRFRLVVDKLKRDTLVSLCGEGIRKISPTQFEMLKSDFEPEQDLAILFITMAR